MLKKLKAKLANKKKKAALKKKKLEKKKKREQRRKAKAAEKQRRAEHKAAKAQAKYDKKDIVAAEKLEKKFDRKAKKWRDKRAAQYDAWESQLRLDELKWEEDLRKARGELLVEKGKDAKQAYAEAVAHNNAIEREQWEDNMHRKRERDEEEARDFSKNPKRSVFRRYLDRHRRRAAEHALAEARDGLLAPPYKRVRPKKYRQYAHPKSYEKL